jgi:oxaloacetate decarboxylase alpha subunit
MLDKVRRTQGPFESDEDLLLALFFMPDVLRGLRDEGPMKLEDPLRFGPLVEVVREAAKRDGVKRLFLSVPVDAR